MKNNKEIKVKNLIALCYSIDEIDTLSKKIKTLIINNNNLYSVCNDISKISRNEFLLGKKNIKEFYKENKEIIDNIQNHTSIWDFIYESYNSDGELNYNVMYYYDYLKEHKNDINRILNLLYKLENLNFENLLFDSKIDFCRNDYEIDMHCSYNFNIYYLENMYAIPNYEKSTVKYKTLNSNYELKLKPYLDGEISLSGREIKLNSLTFDINKLPKMISKENTFNEILKLKKIDDENSVMNSVELSVSVYDLKNQFYKTEQVIKKIDSIENKKELSKLLIEMNTCINGLTTICRDYDKNLEENSDSITRELLEKEKQIYLRRRYYNSIDID